MTEFGFELKATDADARTGIVKTGEGRHPHPSVHAGWDSCYR